MEYLFELLVVLDFDRAIGNVAKFMERFLSAAEICGINPEAVIDAQSRVEAHGKSFNAFTYVQTNAPEKLDGVIRELMKRRGPAILYFEVAEFLFTLEMHNIAHMVLTYSEHEVGQKAKIQASGYPGAYVIINQANKGQYIAGWKNLDGTFSIPSHKGCIVRAKQIILIDDKPEVFRGMPEGCQGFLIHREDNPRPIDMSKLPSGIPIIRSLRDLVIEEKSVRL